MPHPIVTEEDRLLASVRQALEESPYETMASESVIREELIRLRDQIGESKEEDQPALVQQYEHSLAWLEQLRRRTHVTQVDPDNPYFAHMRLRNDDGRSQDVLLGRTTRVVGTARIVDWRHAPVSRVFYRYQQGDEFEEELGDRVHAGTVGLRRVLAIERGKLVRVESPEGVFVHSGDDWTEQQPVQAHLAGGEGATVRVYGIGEAGERSLGTDLAGDRRRLDKRLPDIAGLIDPEQFRLISLPDSGLVVIRGTAGSGKTTVALHRIAFLAYADPTVDSERTLFVVASPALAAYVSHVLPALGVSKARVVTWTAWAAEQRRRHFPMLPVETRADTPAAVVALKLHPAVGIALREQVERTRGAHASAEQAIDDLMSALTGHEALRAVLRQHAPHLASDAVFDRIAAWTRARAEDLSAWLDGDRESGAQLDEEDDALLLRAWQLRMGSLRGKRGTQLRYRHIALDEVQDFSPLEVSVLVGCLDERRSLTLAGDTQQHVMQDAGFTSWAAFFDHLGIPGTEVDTLKVSYRSSAPIVQFALRLLGDLREDDEPPRVVRSGPPVELFRFTDHGAAVAFLARALSELIENEPMASVAVLTPDPDTSAMYAQGFASAEVPRCHRVIEHEFRFQPGIEVTEIAQVKGLEFDYVVLADVSARVWADSDLARRRLHVAATRAVHQLWLVTVGEPAAIVAEAL